MRKMDIIFNVPDSNTQDTLDLKIQMGSLEKLLTKEMRTWWDLTSLKKYIDKEMIPRGLRIKKKPTTVYSDLFQTRWHDVLTDCSIKLMQLIVEYEDEALKDMRIEIKATQEALLKYTDKPLFLQLDEKLKQNLNNLEEHLIKFKQDKYNRDFMDYQTGVVYTWPDAKANTPKSILRKYSRSRRARSSKVSFSSTERESSDSATETVDIPQVMENKPLEGNNANPDLQRKRHGAKNDGPGGNTGRNYRYPSRQRPK